MFFYFLHNWGWDFVWGGAMSQQSLSGKSSERRGVVYDNKEKSWLKFLSNFRRWEVTGLKMRRKAVYWIFLLGSFYSSSGNCCFLYYASYTTEQIVNWRCMLKMLLNSNYKLPTCRQHPQSLSYLPQVSAQLLQEQLPWPLNQRPQLQLQWL